MDTPQHVPVLLEESLEFLAVHPGGVYTDATLGLAGHSAEIARRLGSEGKLIAFDRDPEAMSKAQARLTALAEELGGESGPGMPTVEYVSRPFSEVAQVIAPGTLDGLLADFGVSSLQFDEAHRGFSFRADGPLDMRMDPRSELTAEQVVNQADEEELANLIYEFGEERRSRRIARAIVRARPITTTADLARVVSAVAPPIKSERGRSPIHPATRTFQALRIRVNDELQEIQSLLKSAGSLLKPGGRLVLISFHSLEDRLVKDALRDGAKAGQYELLTKKPIVATEEESLRNPRSRSAKLRAAKKI
ncbi:MAG TPA: 16S rRNA (cytosine(1402)-N(4))-methyltransferase RsmH [Candidatus Aquilonibacter sp.]|nr:16S rRNA (cytosine(1402)-N(4))-methyltransferase RsmH [Candidatus Aquilonibacter sp.]